MRDPGFHSLVVVKSRTGQLDALCRSRAHDWAGVQPLVEVLHNVGGPVVMDRLADAIWVLGGFGRPVMLDVSQLHPSSALWEHPGGPYQYLIDELDRRRTLGSTDVGFVPVVCTKDTRERQTAVGNVLEHLGLGAGVRVPRALASSDALAEVREAVAVLGADPSQVDVVLDAEYVANPVRQATVRILRGQLRRKGWRRFRSVTVLSGSIPPRRAKEDRDQERPEFLLWLNTSCGKWLRYGDYGVVHPVAPSPGGPGRRPRHPFLHYTLPQRSLFRTRRLPHRDLTGDREAQFQQEYFAEIAADVLDRHGGEVESWGDRALQRCVRGEIGFHEPDDWIAIALSHHIAHLATRADLVAEDRR